MIFFEIGMKNIYFIRNCNQTKFVDLIEVNNFALLRFFPIPHIVVKKLNFRFSILKNRQFSISNSFNRKILQF